MEKIPKQRAPCFIEEECNLLLELIKKHREVLENKKTDSATNLQKEETWKRLAEEFNRWSGRPPRDWKVLKGKYENLKKLSKKRFAEEQRNISSTGGVTVKQSVVTQLDCLIKDIIGIQVDGESSQFDSDQGAVMTKDIDNVDCVDVEDETEMTFYLDTSSEVPEIINIDPGTPENQIPSSSKNVEMDDVPSSNKRPRLHYSRPPPLNFGPRRRRFGADAAIAGPSVAKSAVQKSELFIIQKNIYEEKLLTARAEHDMKMEALKLEIEERKLSISLKEREFMARAEHDLRMEVLRLEREERKLSVNLKERDLMARAEHEMKMEALRLEIEDRKLAIRLKERELNN